MIAGRGDAVDLQANLNTQLGLPTGDVGSIASSQPRPCDLAVAPLRRPGGEEDVVLGRTNRVTHEPINATALLMGCLL